MLVLPGLLFQTNLKKSGKFLSEVSLSFKDMFSIEMVFLFFAIVREAIAKLNLLQH